jgi:hypothetical protein
VSAEPPEARADPHQAARASRPPAARADAEAQHRHHGVQVNGIAMSSPKWWAQAGDRVPAIRRSCSFV